MGRSTDSHQHPEGADEGSGNPDDGATGYYQGNSYARFDDSRVMSAFQPIYSIAHRRIVGLEAFAAMDAQVDLVQGYHFARPFLLSESLATQQGLWQTLYNEFDELSAQYAQWRQQQISPYLERFTALTVGKDKRQGLAEIADNMFGMSQCIRLFELTPDGEQCHANLNSPHMQIEGRDRLQALANARGASWKRRDYYVRAINQPGVVQTTRPYFSIADGTLCRTLSVLTQLDGEDFIVCCDILYTG